MFRLKVISSNSNVYSDSPCYDEVRLDFFGRCFARNTRSTVVLCRVYFCGLARKKKQSYANFYANSFIVVVGALTNACRSEIVAEFNKLWGWFYALSSPIERVFFSFSKKKEACGLWFYLIETFYPVFLGS